MAKHTYPVGLVLFILGMCVYKAAMLSTGIGSTWPVFCYLVGLDLILLMMVMLMATFSALFKPLTPRIVLRLILVLIAAVYLVDTFVLLDLDEHAGLFEISRFTPEWGVVLSFFDLQAYVAISLFLLSIFYARIIEPRLSKTTCVLLVLLLTGGVASNHFAPVNLTRYAILNTNPPEQARVSLQAVSSYSSGQIDDYRALEQPRAQIPESRPDIILLIVESLSSINSKKISGVNDLLGRFDLLAQKGLLFTNFFANHQASEGGLIALLGGHPPMHFPTATPYMFDEFARVPTVVGEYRQAGYYTGFLTNSELAFIGLSGYLDGLGLDLSRGRDEIEAMRNAPRFTQYAPADNYLYEEALLTTRQLSTKHRPFLLALASTSTHLPYAHPEGGPDTAEAIWDWSLQQVQSFHEDLEDSGFFEHGVLLITGDHRQMRQVTHAETQRYGDGARARVPLLIIGNGYREDSTDQRFFQQSDLLRMLGRVGDTDVPLSPQVIWVERYNRRYGQVARIDQLSVFSDIDLGRHEHRLRVLGNRLEWLGERPGFALEMENRIHAQRSLHQQQRNGVTNTCRPAWINKTSSATNISGLSLGFFDRSNPDGVTNMHELPEQNRFETKKVVISGKDVASAGKVALFRGFINIEENGVYRFRVGGGLRACMSLDMNLVLDQRANTAAHEVSVELTRGLHHLDLRFSELSTRSKPVLEWVTPAERQWWWKEVPASVFFLASSR